MTYKAWGISVPGLSCHFALDSTPATLASLLVLKDQGLCTCHSLLLEYVLPPTTQSFPFLLLRLCTKVILSSFKALHKR